MRAALRDRYGPPEVVGIREVERPSPVADQVLVRVRAASVNRADLDGLYPRWQFTRAFMGVRRPREHRVGLDVAGVVEAVGPDVTTFRPGDHVFADLFAFGMGAFADYACAPERAFATLPDGLSFEESAALPHSGILGIQGLRRRDGTTPRPGDRVLVNGASGNVGPFAVQVAKALGAEVTGTARAEKLDFVRSLGADRAIDYTSVDVIRAGERYDWIVDVESRHLVTAYRRILRPGGTYVMLGGPTSAILGAIAGPVVSAATGTHLALLTWWKPFPPADVARLKALIASGDLRPRIDRRYPLEDIVEALRWVDEGHARGKVIITVSDD